MKSTYYTKSLVDTIKLGFKLGETLRNGDTVLLFGNLGAGKTHFTKGIAEAMNVDQLIKSPTFAYVHTYPIKGGELYHYDLYRVSVGEDLTSIGYEETLDDPTIINVVEWADRLRDNLPTRYIRVDFEIEGDFRSISIEWVYPERLTEDRVEDYYEEWVTPMHVREHCKQVANVAKQLATAHMAKFEIIDLGLLTVSCLLHDMCRVCDFKELDRNRFEEEVTDEKWKKWLELRKQYKGLHHGDIAAHELFERGYVDTAEAIRLHKSVNIIDDFDSFDSLEKMITYYADKRVKHTEIVDLTERFRDGRERYSQYNPPEQEAKFLEVEKRVKDLEKALFEGLSIQPQDIR